VAIDFMNSLDVFWIFFSLDCLNFFGFFFACRETHLENLEGSRSPLWTKGTLWHFIWSFWWHAQGLPRGYAPSWAAIS
jgi:hypothetical protein